MSLLLNLFLFRRSVFVILRVYDLSLVIGLFFALQKANPNPEDPAIVCNVSEAVCNALLIPSYTLCVRERGGGGVILYGFKTMVQRIASIKKYILVTGINKRY